MTDLKDEHWIKQRYEEVCRANPADYALISLIKNESDPRERVLIRHIVETAKELNMKVVAEGVENRGYLDILKEPGCDYAQGFVFYKPMPAEAFEERFIKNKEKAQI